MARPTKDETRPIRALAIEAAIARLKPPATFTLAELARDIGCSAPALYSHFTGKSAPTLFAEGIAACQRQGFAPPRPPREVALLLWSLAHGAVLLALDAQLPGEEEARWDAAFGMVDSGLALLAGVEIGPR
ncbi:MAG: hypothetical protein Kilf2KO_31880 [Rhodospirillales bacterium]